MQAQALTRKKTAIFNPRALNTLKLLTPAQRTRIVDQYIEALVGDNPLEKRDLHLLIGAVDQVIAQKIASAREQPTDLDSQRALFESLFPLEQGVYWDHRENKYMGVGGINALIQQSRFEGFLAQQQVNKTTTAEQST